MYHASRVNYDELHYATIFTLTRFYCSKIHSLGFTQQPEPDHPSKKQCIQSPGNVSHRAELRRRLHAAASHIVHQSLAHRSNELL
jgi:hypothetical protein